MDAFYLAKKGWRPQASGPADAECIYYRMPRDWHYGQGEQMPQSGYHAARKSGCNCGAGKWIMFQSKCGQAEKIEHVWDQLGGSFYGDLHRYYK